MLLRSGSKLSTETSNVRVPSNLRHMASGESAIDYRYEERLELEEIADEERIAEEENQRIIAAAAEQAREAHIATVALVLKQKRADLATQKRVAAELRAAEELERVARWTIDDCAMLFMSPVGIVRTDVHDIYRRLIFEMIGMSDPYIAADWICRSTILPECVAAIGMLRGYPHLTGSNSSTRVPALILAMCHNPPCREIAQCIIENLEHRWQNSELLRGIMHNVYSRDKFTGPQRITEVIKCTRRAYPTPTQIKHARRLGTKIHGKVVEATYETTYETTLYVGHDIGANAASRAIMLQTIAYWIPELIRRSSHPSFVDWCKEYFGVHAVDFVRKMYSKQNVMVESLEYQSNSANVAAHKKTTDMILRAVFAPSHFDAVDRVRACGSIAAAHVRNRVLTISKTSKQLVQRIAERVFPGELSNLRYYGLPLGPTTMLRSYALYCSVNNRPIGKASWDASVVRQFDDHGEFHANAWTVRSIVGMPYACLAASLDGFRIAKCTREQALELDDVGRNLFWYLLHGVKVGDRGSESAALTGSVASFLIACGVSTTNVDGCGHNILQVYAAQGASDDLRLSRAALVSLNITHQMLTSPHLLDDKLLVCDVFEAQPGGTLSMMRQIIKTSEQSAQAKFDFESSLQWQD